MSSIKISQLPQLPSIAANTSNTLFLGVDLPTGITGKFTATTLAQQLFANNALTVGNNIILFSNTVAQFSGLDESFLQVNMQNFDANGSGDFVITGNKGTNSNNYIDLGLSGSDFVPNPTVGTAFLPDDGYLYVHGPQENGYIGNLLIGTATTNTKILFTAGGLDVENIVGYIDGTGLHFENIDAEMAANLVAAMAYTNTKILQVNSNAANLTSYAQAAFGTANTANASVTNLAGTVNILQSQLASNANAIVSLTGYTQSAYNTVNSLVISSNTAALSIQTQAAFNLANTNSNGITSLIVVNGVQNNSINAVSTLATNNAANIANLSIRTTAAFAKANNALANTTGSFNGDLTVLGKIKIGDGTLEYPPSASPATFLITSNTSISLQANNSSWGFGTDASTHLPGQLDVSGQTIIANSNYDYVNTALVRIIGSTGAAVVPPSNPGYMLSIYGVDGVPSRLVNNAFGSGAYPIYIMRKGNGTAANPTTTANNDIVARIAGNGYNGNGFAQFGQSRIDFVATENYTTANNGSEIQFWNTPIGSNVINKIATFNGNHATFTGFINPMKGFVYSPNNQTTVATTFTIDITNDAMLRYSVNDNATIALTNHMIGKVIDLWITNSAGQNKTITHGCFANNSTNKLTTFTIQANACAYLRYFCVNGDIGNTFVSIIA